MLESFVRSSMFRWNFVCSLSQLRGGSRVLARPVSVSVFNRPEARTEQVRFLMLDVHMKQFKNG